jgi:hypothetical protein
LSLYSHRLQPNLQCSIHTPTIPSCHPYPMYWIIRFYDIFSMQKLYAFDKSYFPYDRQNVVPVLARATERTENLNIIFFIDL